MANYMMEDVEIARSFKQADDKLKQVKVLSELNGCTEEDIIEVLKHFKIPVDEISKPKKKGKGRSKRNKVEDEKSPPPDKSIHEIVKMNVPKCVIVACKRMLEDVEEEISNLSMTRKELMNFINGANINDE